MIDYLAAPPPPPTPMGQLYDLARLLTILVSIYCLGQIAMLYTWWARLPVFLRFMLLSNLIFVVVVGYGVTESYLLNIPGGLRSVAVLVSVIYCAVGLTLGVRAVGRNPLTKE